MTCFHDTAKKAINKFAENNPSKKIEGGVIYQYTDVGAMKGIVSNKELWATHFRYLNDENEFKYGLSKTSEKIEELINGGAYRNEETIAFLKSMKNIVENKEKVEELECFYVVCFSEEKDKLSQWRGYGKKEKSICLGFDYESIKEKCKGLENSCYFAKVEYSKIDTISKKLKEYCDLIELNDDGSGLCKDGLFELKKDVFISALFVKEKCWDEEKEWRIVVHRKKDLEFKESDKGLVPYIKFKLDDVAADIKCVTLPKSVFDYGKLSVNMFLKLNGLTFEASPSDISIVY